jgi:hypothetical protein
MPATRISVAFSDDELRAIKAAANPGESTYGYLKRVALSHAAGAWKAPDGPNLATELEAIRQAIGALRPTAGSTASTGSDPELSRQVAQLIPAMASLAGLVEQMQQGQRAILDGQAALIKALEAAL